MHMADASNASEYPAAMALLKAGVGFFDSKIPEAMETYLESLLCAADARLARRKIYICVGEIDDDMLLAMYAEWLYRKKASGARMPDMLREEIKSRQVDNAIK
jgi:hypothetical protein